MASTSLSDGGFSVLAMPIRPAAKPFILEVDSEFD
jgi:hypothetical protein